MGNRGRMICYQHRRHLARGGIASTNSHERHPVTARGVMAGSWRGMGAVWVSVHVLLSQVILGSGLAGTGCLNPGNDHPFGRTRSGSRN